MKSYFYRGMAESEGIASGSSEEKVAFGQIDGGGSADNQTPSKPAGVMSWSANMANLTSWKDNLLGLRETWRPISQFTNSSKFGKPSSIQQTGKRIVTNVEHFRSNYIAVIFIMFLYCILTSPTLLIVIAAVVGACYILSLKNREQKMKILGRELTISQQYAGVALVSFPLFWLAGAGSAVFWAIGASCFVIMLHAAMFASDLEGQDAFELTEIETV